MLGGKGLGRECRHLEVESYPLRRASESPMRWRGSYAAFAGPLSRASTGGSDARRRSPSCVRVRSSRQVGTSRSRQYFGSLTAPGPCLPAHLLVPRTRAHKTPACVRAVAHAVRACMRPSGLAPVARNAPHAPRASHVCRQACVRACVRAEGLAIGGAVGGACDAMLECVRAPPARPRILTHPSRPPHRCRPMRA